VRGETDGERVQGLVTVSLNTQALAETFFRQVASLLVSPDTFARLPGPDVGVAGTEWIRALDEDSWDRYRLLAWRSALFDLLLPALQPWLMADIYRKCERVGACSRAPAAAPRQADARLRRRWLANARAC
jgi:hypothetical protein